MLAEKNKKTEYSVVDVFCGIGGLTHGFLKEKFHIAGGIDFDPTCQYAYEKNNKTKFIHADITKITPEEVLALYPKDHKKILVGCAPCQPFSIYNTLKKPKESQSKDSKWRLLYSFAELIKKVKPDIISMENVPLLAKFNGGQVLNDFKKSLEEDGYKITWKIVNAQDYGVPQRRKRLILLGSKFGEIEIIAKTVKGNKFRTVKDAIGKLSHIKDGVSDPKDPLHRARKLTELNKKRIKATPEGGSWHDWKDKSLLLDCHKKEAGKAFGSVYGRMKWDDVAPTMTTFCTGLNNGRFGHPEQDRAISLREAALIQSFPINYKFINPAKSLPSATIARQIGNAVPVGLGVAIARSIKNHLISTL